MVENGIPILASLEEQRHPLLENDHDQQTIPPDHRHQKPQKTPAQRAIRKTFKLIAHLANLLPTGSVLAFQILSPIFSHEGNCHTSTSQNLTLVLLDLCVFSCFVSVLVFSAVALLDHNVVTCLLPTPSEYAKELLLTLPIAIGVICSLLFVALPTTRHGIGFPLSRF